jgi:hypothetical protein
MGLFYKCNWNKRKKTRNKPNVYFWSFEFWAVFAICECASIFIQPQKFCPLISG